MLVIASYKQEFERGPIRRRSMLKKLSLAHMDRTVFLLMHIVYDYLASMVYSAPELL